MRFGLRQASGIPPQGQRDVRDLTRSRTKLVQARVREVQRLQGGLERANITLASVVSDILGVWGRALREALRAGKAAPATMADVAKRRMRATLPLLEPALTGVVRDHHRQVLAMQLAHIDGLDEPIAALNTTMAMALSARSAAAPLSPQPLPRATASSALPLTGAMPLTLTRAVELLETLPGVDQRGAEVLVTEIGSAMARFETAPRLAAWAGVAPGNDASAGKQRAGKTRKGHRALRAMLPPLAHAAVRTKGTYVSALSQRLAARRGQQRAIMAVAHSMMRRVFPMLSRHESSRELGANYCDERRRHSTVDRLTRRIEPLGYRVHLEPVASVA